MLRAASIAALFTAFAAVAIFTSLTAPGSSDEERAVTVLRRYMYESSEGDIDKAFALVGSEAKRSCSAEKYREIVEWQRGSPIRRISDIRVEGIRVYEEEIEELGPESLFLIVKLSLQSTEGGRREVEAGPLMSKADGDWRVWASRNTCVSLIF
jgi:hypothetical protein